MNVDAITLNLRPRSMFEASDLGVRLTAVHAGDIWRSTAPVYAFVVVLALSTVELATWAPTLVLFWLKPWLDRTVLFVLSRAVFGHRTRFADVWAAQRSVWWSQLLPTLTVRRFSPWRASALPAQMLEGQAGAAQRKRVNQLLKDRRGAAFGVQWGFASVETALTVGFVALIMWLGESNTGVDWMRGLMKTNGTAAALLQSLGYACTVAFVEPFFVGAGFVTYLNRRVELEAWDIEQEFRLAFAA